MIEYFLGPLGVLFLGGITALAYKEPERYARLAPYLTVTIMMSVFAGVCYSAAYTSGYYDALTVVREQSDKFISSGSPAAFPFDGLEAMYLALGTLLYVNALVALPWIMGASNAEPPKQLTGEDGISDPPNSISTDRPKAARKKNS